MSARSRQNFAREQRRCEVSELYLQGYSQSVIASRLQVTQSTVSADIRVIQNFWRASSIRNFDLLREIELRKLDRVEREAWAGWERSQQPVQSAVMQGEGSGSRTRKSIRNQVGNPRFLEQVNKCISQRRTLLGLDAPLQVADVSPHLAETQEQRTLRLQRIFQLLLPAPDSPHILDAET